MSGCALGDSVGANRATFENTAGGGVRASPARARVVNAEVLSLVDP